MVIILEPSKSLLSSFTVIRSEVTPRNLFVFHSERIIRKLIDRALDELDYNQITVKTPTGLPYEGLEPAGNICGVSIMRAADSMVGVFRQIAPSIKIGKILIQRDEETHLPHLYYKKLPKDISTRHVFLLDPMLATGGSAMKAIEVLVEQGVPEEKIIFINLIACPEGLKALADSYPKVQIITAFVDEALNQDKYIIPGLGDFGCRYFGTD